MKEIDETKKKNKNPGTLFLSLKEDQYHTDFDILTGIELKVMKINYQIYNKNSLETLESMFHLINEVGEFNFLFPNFQTAKSPEYKNFWKVMMNIFKELNIKEIEMKILFIDSERKQRRTHHIMTITTFKKMFDDSNIFYKICDAKYGVYVSDDLEVK